MCNANYRKSRLISVIAGGKIEVQPPSVIEWNQCAAVIEANDRQLWRGRLIVPSWRNNNDQRGHLVGIGVSPGPSTLVQSQIPTVTTRKCHGSPKLAPVVDFISEERLSSVCQADRRSFAQALEAGRQSSRRRILESRRWASRG